MGQVIIELPQAVNRTYRIEDVETSEKLLCDLEKFEQKSQKQRVVIPPRRKRLKEDSDRVSGIWADKPEINKPQKQTIKPNLPDDLSDVSEDAVLGIWANREESAEEIACQIRQKNRQAT